MPLVALVDGARATADRDGPRRGACPGCGREMSAKTGDVVTWHWAHLHDQDADACHVEPETEWHLNWKARCPDPDRIEAVRGNRRADVLTPYEWALEFQHSAISVSDARSRERDWRKHLIWIVDAREAYTAERLTLRRPHGREHYALRWAWSPAWVRESGCRMFLDLGDGELVMVGRWYDKNPDAPVNGYGWRLTADTFTECVISGVRPPSAPRKLGAPLDPAAWLREPERPVVLPAVRRAPVLNWSDRGHWNGGRTAPCHLCNRPTFLLDDDGRPAHKTCTEEAMERPA